MWTTYVRISVARVELAGVVVGVIPEQEDRSVWRLDSSTINLKAGWKREANIVAVWLVFKSSKDVKSAFKY